MKKSTFSEEQIVRILQEAASGQKTQVQVCRDHGVSTNTFYRWKTKFGAMSPTEVRRLKELEEENARLKKLVADLSLDRQILQDALRTKV